MDIDGIRVKDIPPFDAWNRRSGIGILTSSVSPFRSRTKLGLNGLGTDLQATVMAFRQTLNVK